MQDVVGPRKHPVSRRLALVAPVAAGAVAGATGCQVRSPLEEPRRDDPAPAPVDPDLALRDAAQLAVVAQLHRVRSTLEARPRLTSRLRPLADLHAQHVEALPGAPSPTATPVPAGTWGAVLQGERSLGRQLAGMAQRAESGGFARLLASMAAAIDQHLARQGDR